jgi:molybdopterin molybdotransferase
MTEGEAPSEIGIRRTVSAGDYVRPKGQDVEKGRLLLKTGHRLRAQDIGILAGRGISNVRAYKIPVVAILSAGEELLDPSEPMTPGKIYDMNSHSLAAAVQAAGGKYIRLGIAEDTHRAVSRIIHRAIRSDVDMIVSSAGVSMGAFDYLRVELERNGEVQFWRVNMRPGKPFLFGSYQLLPFFGLPGNPVSALVTFEIFVRPAIERMGGVPEFRRVRQSARTEERIESDGRESYLRSYVWWEAGEYRARLTGNQDSGILFSLVEANAFVIVPAGVMSAEAGELVNIQFIGPPAPFG